MYTRVYKGVGMKEEEKRRRAYIGPSTYPSIYWFVRVGIRSCCIYIHSSDPSCPLFTFNWMDRSMPLLLPTNAFFFSVSNPIRVLRYSLAIYRIHERKDQRSIAVDNQWGALPGSFFVCIPHENICPDIFYLPVTKVDGKRFSKSTLTMASCAIVFFTIE